MLKIIKKEIVTPKTPKEAFEEAEIFYQNAKEVLKKSPIKFGAFEKPKYVKEASAMEYLAALRSIDGYLLSKGFLPQNLPTSIKEYEDALAKIPQNGKLLVALEIAYQDLHIFGYYRDGVGVEMIKEGFSKVKFIIDTLKKITNKAIRLQMQQRNY
ncbi:MAG: DUF5618 family protein [candidate division WOR-3 bacterium]